MPVIESPTQPGQLAEVDADSNLKVNLPRDPTLSGYVRNLSADGNDIDVTENNALRVSSSNLILYEQVDGANVNTNVWNPLVGTMTIVQANGFIGLNAGASTATGAYAILQSIKLIPLYGTLPLKMEVNAKCVNIPEANCTVEIGLGTVSTNSAPSDGAFFRWNPAGQFVCVVNNGGAENASAALISAYTDNNGNSISLPPSNSVIHLYTIEVVEDKCRFFVDDILITEIDTPAGQAYPFNAGRQNVFFRAYNGGSSPSAAPQFFIGQVVVVQEDLNKLKPWSTVLSTLGRGFYQSPLTPFGQTANHANSAAPVAATLSNTVAGYATLGGKFAINSQAAGAMDGIVFGYQNVTGYQLTISGISISTAVTGAAIVTATLLDWSMGVNASAISLATTDGAGTWAPRRIPLGVQGFTALLGVGGVSNDLVRNFDPPLVVDSGRFLHIILTTPNGAATGSLVYRGAVTILGGVTE